jgi:hypothetical protein
LKGTGFTGCGKTHPGKEAQRLCNKGTALAGPQNAKRKLGFSPCGNLHFSTQFLKLLYGFGP